MITYNIKWSNWDLQVLYSYVRLSYMTSINLGFSIEVKVLFIFYPMSIKHKTFRHPKEYNSCTLPYLSKIEIVCVYELNI